MIFSVEVLKGRVALMDCLLFCLLSVLRICEVVVSSPVCQIRALLCSAKSLLSVGWTVLRVGKVSAILNALYRNRAEVAS